MKTAKKQALGYHKNNKRLWINNGTITDASLEAGDSVIHIYNNDKNELVIEKSESGLHKISETHKGGVIDIVNAKITNLFKDNDYVDVIADNGRIVITGNYAESKITERERSLIRRVETGEPLRKGGAFSGLGLLCRSIHRGLRKSGVSVKQRFANEYNPIPAEVNISGNEIWDDSFSDAIFSIDDIYTMDMSVVPKLDVLIMGSPCPAFSQLNTQLEKRGEKDIFHPDSGTIFQPMLEMIRKANPAIVLLENSKYFKGSIFDYIMSDVMSRYGYTSTSTLVTGHDFGDFEKRERLCQVWYSEGLSVPNFEDLPFQSENKRAFSDLLEPIDKDDKRWGRRTYLEAKDAQEHNGHKYCITPPNASKIPTCGANYHKIQPDSAMVMHPERAMVTRIMTPSEHCNLRDIDGRLKENIVAVEKGEHYAQRTSRGSASEAHRMLGNSCSPKPWESIGYRIGEWLLGMTNRVKSGAFSTPSRDMASYTEANQTAFSF